MRLGEVVCLVCLVYLVERQFQGDLDRPGLPQPPTLQQSV
jgi:hypothetical protein